MSIHPSLRGASNLVGDRSVYTRIERVQKLIREGKLEEDGSPFGLPKVRTRIKVKVAKVITEDGAEGDAGAEGSADAPEASEG
ncbi:MAG TPA: small basic protein [Planctomycetes bacterium]|nr:small basic protein [Planctomycetota bacterium]HIL36788.1 small basic protein [Planctomycetota bacterium]